MFNLKETLMSYIVSIGSNDLLKKLAEERMEFCINCDVKREIFHNKKWSAICGRCGCPIEEKILTDQYGTCPLKKWNQIEEIHINHLKIKKNSII